MILHITTRNEWDQAQTAGEYKAPSLQTDGFIHCSTINQTAETANMFFKGRKDLILLCIDENKLKAECRYEAPCCQEMHNKTAENLFPHIYGPIDLTAIVNVVDLNPGEEGLFELPTNLK